MNDLIGENLSEIVTLKSELQTIEKLSKSVGDSITNAFRGALLYGKSLSSLLSDIALSFADIALKAALKPLGSMISNSISGLFTTFNPAIQATPFAKGGVVSAPQYFGMGQNGLGLMGEAGAEAILPLHRGADGRLGVQASGSKSTQITFNVTSPDARSFSRSQTQISAQLARAVARGHRGL